MLTALSLKGKETSKGEEETWDDCDYHQTARLGRGPCSEIVNPIWMDE